MSTDPQAPGAAPRPGAPGRSAAEIRRDIDLQQAELAGSVVALRERVREARVIAGRNCLDPAVWRAAGWTYRALGRP